MNQQIRSLITRSLGSKNANSGATRTSKPCLSIKDESEPCPHDGQERPTASRRQKNSNHAPNPAHRTPTHTSFSLAHRLPFPARGPMSSSPTEARRRRSKDSRAGGRDLRAAAKAASCAPPPDPARTALRPAARVRAGDARLSLGPRYRTRPLDSPPP
jgi:hypothetical protein